MTKCQREKHGNPIVCLENGRIFPSQGAAINWLKENGATKASQSLIYKALYKKRMSAYGFTWAFCSTIKKPLHTISKSVIDTSKQAWALFDGRTQGKRPSVADLAISYPNEFGELA